MAGFDVGELRASKLPEILLPQLLAKAGLGAHDAKSVRGVCAIDPINQIDSAVAGMDAHAKGVVIVAFKGTTRGDVDACFRKLAQGSGKTVTLTAKGDLTVFAGIAPTNVYVRWLAMDVLAIADSPGDKALLTAMTSGGLAGDKAMAPLLAGSTTDSAFWALVAKSGPLPELGATLVRAYALADAKAGNLATEVHLVLDSAKAASAAVAKAKQLVASTKKAGKVPPDLAGALAAVTLGSVGAELVGRATMPAATFAKALGGVLPR